MKDSNSYLPRSPALIPCVEPLSPHVHIPTMWATDSERCGQRAGKFTRIGEKWQICVARNREIVAANGQLHGKVLAALRYMGIG